MPWIYLWIASAIEIAWAVGLKYTDGFKRPVPSLLVGLGMIATYYFLAQAAKTIPIGTAYAVWTGVGAVGTALMGMILFKEPSTAARFACIALIVAGIAGLKVTTPASP
jgi:quaternary ammonium compound-resistance protein SugE